MHNLSMNRLSTEKRAKIIGCLVEGMSIRATSRLTGASTNTIDNATIVKLYGHDQDERRYSPPTCIGIDKTVVMGDPDPERISTSYVERQNLTMRMGMRRFTRLTNAFSKKIENHTAAVSLHFMHYNFARTHKSLKNPYPQTRAMAAGVADHV